MAEDLEAKLKELKKKHTELDAQYKKAETQMVNTKEFKALRERRKENDEKQDTLRVKIDAKEKKICERFLDEPESHPYYSRTGYGGVTGEYTSINDYTLASIRNNLSISKLRGSDIEAIVRSLMERERVRTGVKELNQECEILRKEWSAIFDEERNFETEEIKNIERERFHVYQEIRVVEDRIKNPEKHKGRDDREAERAKAIREDVLDAIEKDVEGYKKAYEAED